MEKFGYLRRNIIQEYLQRYRAMDPERQDRCFLNGAQEITLLEALRYRNGITSG